MRKIKAEDLMYLVAMYHSLTMKVKLSSQKKKKKH